jgi:hypothetical protein
MRFNLDISYSQKSLLNVFVSGHLVRFCIYGFLGKKAFFLAMLDSGTVQFVVIGCNPCAHFTIPWLVELFLVVLVVISVVLCLIFSGSDWVWWALNYVGHGLYLDIRFLGVKLLLWLMTCVISARGIPRDDISMVGKPAIEMVCCSILGYLRIEWQFKFLVCICSVLELLTSLDQNGREWMDFVTLSGSAHTTF